MNESQNGPHSARLRRGELQDRLKAVGGLFEMATAPKPNPAAKNLARRELADILPLLAGELRGLADTFTALGEGSPAGFAELSDGQLQQASGVCEQLVHDMQLFDDYLRIER
ncbi:hypothetical protein GCM10023195_26000 [Actinoallomurus liliacearum]|uniref:Uncharacterized protein n=1 Tax=Actinoallomurus liliacearum TaxID=1080073 RepID=A0ABP8TFI4_9ACTN